MAKKRSSFPSRLLPSWIKKSPAWGIVALLAWALTHLVGDIQSSSQPVKLPSSNEPVELYANQVHDNLTNLFESFIDQAQHSITLSIYALTDEKIIKALQNKSLNPQVQIFIVCDAKASPGITRNLPQATIVRRTSQGLMHQKILIIDDKFVLIGSANFTYSSLNTHGNLVMGVENPALAQALSERIKNMDEDGKMVSTLHRETEAGPQHLELWVLPDDPAAVNRMLDLFRTAQKSIKVAMFTWTRTDFAEEIIQAAKRGVKVEVVLDRYAGKGASSKIVTLLTESNIPVTLSTGKGLLHHKFVWIDDKILVNGSANWTQAAFKINDDFFAIINPLTTQQQLKMADLWTIIKKQSASPNAVPKQEFPYGKPTKQTKRSHYQKVGAQ